MTIEYLSRIQSLNEEKRLHFYEVLAHKLTVSIRSVWSDDDLNDSEKVEQIKAINEILHRVTSKVWVTRLRSHEWSDSDMLKSFEHWIAGAPNVSKEVEWAIESSLNSVQ